MGLSDVVPSFALRSIDRVRTRRFLSKTGPPTVEYVRRNGLVVARGPFAGMRYLGGLERTSGDLVAKLAGTYERELHPSIDEWIRSELTDVIDVGCAEGYYAVGLALKMPEVMMHAFDIDADARSRCATLAQLNGVEARVQLGGECTPETLRRFPQRGVALLSDCEGFERRLLDPKLAPQLVGWPILVELHDFIDPDITDTIVSRFAPTHEIELIDGQGRDNDLPELGFMSPPERAAVLGERRPGPMRWAHLRPREQTP
jgi:hypothetical protein